MLCHGFFMLLLLDLMSRHTWSCLHAKDNLYILLHLAVLCDGFSCGTFCYGMSWKIIHIQGLFYNSSHLNVGSLSLQANARITGRANVWVTGHSSGGSLAYMVAMALASGKIPGYSVQGVISFGSPRTGNVEFQTDYNNLLRTKTLRINNDGDYYATEGIPFADPSGTVVPAEYRSVGKGVAMCVADDGTASFVYPTGADEDLNSASCLANGAADIPPDAMTDNTGLHALGNYFDTWRRAYFTATGSNLAYDMRLRAVLCVPCAWPTVVGGLSFAMSNQPQMSIYVPWNYPARVGGLPLVTCHNDASCSSVAAFNAATAIGSGATAAYNVNAVCNTQPLMNGAIPSLYNCQLSK